MAHIKLPINRLKKGMTICNEVYSRSGVVIVPANTLVTKEVVELLTKHFISYVVVNYQVEEKEHTPAQKPDVQEGLITKESESYKHFEESFQIVEEALSDNLKDLALHNKDVNVHGLVTMVNQVLESAGGEFRLCDMLQLMKNDAENLYTHSINVALFGQILAKWMEFSEEDTERVILASLLHDIGILQITENPDRDVFQEELKNGRYKNHVMKGYNLLKDKDLDNSVKQAVLTHHERLDGSGFPMCVEGKHINLISRIVAVADTYDTLTMNADISASSSPFAVLAELDDLGRHKFDVDMLLTFISHITNSFIQHTVLLSNGEKAQIVLIHKFDAARPMVRIGNQFVDLASRSDISIVKILD